MPSSVVLPDSISPSLSTFYVCVALIIVLCSIILNLIVIITIYSGSEPKTPMDFYILNIAVSDIVSSIFGTISVDNVNMEWNVGTGFCKASYTIVFCCYSVAIMSLCAMGIERYYGICKPAKPTQTSVFKKNHVTIPIIWMSSGSLFVVYFYAYGIKNILVSDGTTKRVCDETWEDVSRKYFLLFIPFLALLVAPVAVITAVYVRIMQKFGDPRTPRSSGGNAVLYKKRKRTVHMLITMVLVHYICWSPTIILKLLSSFGPQMSWYWPAWTILEMLHYVRPIFYPFIYYFMYHHFKTNMRAIFRSCGPYKGTTNGGVPRERRAGSSFESDGSREFQYQEEESPEYCTEM